jgi:pimeloyl-ACP methyl ester carboxylesterase
LANLTQTRDRLIDDTGASGYLAARVLVPERPTPTTAILVCVPGAGYTREYFDFGIEGYSFAAAATAAGHVVVALDNLGTGESFRPADGDSVTLAAMARANAHVTRRLVREAQEGILAPGLPPLERPSVVGIGHSLGACLVLLQQAAEHSFDGIAVLGFSNRPLAGIYEPHEREHELTAAERRDWAIEHIPPKIWGVTWDAMPPYFDIPRAGFHGLFYCEDTPAALIEADTALATVTPRVAAIEVITPHVSAAAAAAVTAPVFLAFGAVDLSPDPLGEVATYPAAPDITLIRLERSAHCHNFAPDRQRLWRRLIAWADGVGEA